MALSKNITNVLFFRATAPILIHIYENKEKCIAQHISKKLDITYSHVVKVLKIFDEEKLIETERTGRVRYIMLTDKGKKLGKYMKEICEVLNAIRS